MNPTNVLDTAGQCKVLQWAQSKQIALTISVLPDAHWNHLRSQLVRFDSDQGLLQIVYPMAAEHSGGVLPEIVAGQELGVSFRRGHKKCIFVSPVVMRQADTLSTGQTIDTLILRAPRTVREMQRRLYQRITIPPDRLIAAKLWQGGVPSGNEACWPLCAGRVGNISLGGLLLDIRAEQNPRLTVGELVGVEITTRPGKTPLLAAAQYRHCVLLSQERLGLGLQFIGFEADTPGRATLTEVADFVRELRRHSPATHEQASDAD
jgi:c-di-GMP-binding flagellar brake protein YcgR